MTNHTMPNGTSPRVSSRWRKALTAVLGALFVACFLAFTVGVVVHKDLLDPELYIQVLADNNVYDRLYTEVLADPALQDRFKARLGVDLDLVVEELYAQIVAAGAMVVPPAALQAATEAVIRRVVTYVRGDVPDLDATLRPRLVQDPKMLARNVVAGLTSAAAEALADVPADEEVPRAALDEAALRTYIQGLANGEIRRIPEGVRNASVAGLTAGERGRLVDTLLGPEAGRADEQTRLQIEASLASDDLPSAVAAASMTVLRPRVEGSAATLAGRLAESGALDGLAAAASAVGKPRASIVHGLNTVRSYAGLAQTALVPLAIFMLVLLATIVWLNSDDLRSALASGGWALVVAGGLGLGLWLVAGWWVKAALGARLEAATGLPPGLGHVVNDVLGSLNRAVFGSIWSVTLFWVVVGTMALAFAYSSRLAALLRRALDPVWPHRSWVLVGLFGLVVIVPLLGRVVTARQREANPPCNGHPELCHRPVNEVVFATTHNAMSITEFGWLWPMHDGTVTDQLEAGVRALLVDTHYVDDTESEAEFLASLRPDERVVAEKAIAAFPDQDLIGALLCHGSCRLGATLLADTLEEVRIFLENNPREVVVVVIQDEITAEDTVRVFSLSGLVPYIYTHQAGDPWPTLAQMIADGRRLIVMAENEGPPPDWYTNAWEVTEETPYTFVFKEDFSCEPNRGGTGKPFFMLNHWIQRGAPNRADAAVVNDHDFLLGRAQQCAEARGKVPNFIAVNFYRQGDLMHVVDILNGVGPSVKSP